MKIWFYTITRVLVKLLDDYWVIKLTVGTSLQSSNINFFINVCLIFIVFHSKPRSKVGG